MTRAILRSSLAFEPKHISALLGAGLFFLGAVSCVAQGSCGLDARNLRNRPLPELSAAQMPAAVAADLRHGYDLVAQGETASGEQIFRKIMASSAGRGDRCAEALVLFARGQMARRTQLAEALPLLRQSEEILRSVGTPLARAYVHGSIATTEHQTGDNAAYLRDAPAVQQELRDAGDEAAAILERSRALQYAGNGQHPEEQRALLHELESVSSANVTAVRGFVEWEAGSSMRRSGRYNEILALFQASLTDLTRCDCEQETRASVLLNFAAAADANNDPDAMLSYARQADALYRRYGLETLRPQALRLMAVGYARQRDWPRAIATYETALRMAREKHASFALASTGEELAAAYGNSGHPLQGLEVLQQAEPVELTPEQRCSVRARRSILKSQAHLYSSAVDDGASVLAECKSLMQPSDFAMLQFHNAVAQFQLEHTEEAVALARESVRIGETQRLRLASNDRTLRLYNEQKAAVYSVLIAALVKLQRPEEALLASEQFRARAFVDLANSSRTDAGAPTAGPPPSPQPHAEAQLRSQPHAFELTVQQIRDSLEHDRSTLVSYWLSEDGHLYTWVMAPGSAVVQHEQRVDPVQLAALVKATLPAGAAGARGQGRAVATRGGGAQTVAFQTRRPWQQLYDLLIAPVAQQLPQQNGSLLTIVPQGVLFQLSFPALMDRQQHYLVERYAIHTVPSAGTLQITMKNEAASATLPSSYLLLANPASYPEVQGRQLPPLPGTGAGVRGIARELNGRAVVRLEGRQAGIDSLERELPQATVLHFATHAIVSDTDPATSYLALDRGQRGGLLSAGSVYGLHMKTSLVVLSACSTGRGQISGDGVAGLSRAFFYAGAASLVTTLWDVIDEPTARLMPSFYAGLAKGESRSAALRNAQLRLIDDLRLHRVRLKALDGTSVSLPENPAYWAAFSLMGQP